MNDELFAELLASVRESGAILRGEKDPSRQFVIEEVNMATTLVIDDHLIEEARIIGKHSSATDVVVEALREYIQYRKQLQILTLFGTIDYDDTYNYKEQRQRL